MKLIRLALVALPLCLAAACSNPITPEAEGAGTLGSGSQLSPESGPSYGAGTLGSGS